MSGIAVVTDSDASLPSALAARYGITIVPINVHFGDEVFRSEVDIDDGQLFARVQRDGALPTTSAPTPGQFAAAFQAAFDAGADQVLCLNVSGLVSGTYNAALNARELVSGGDVTVMDTRSLSMGQGFMALAASWRWQPADNAALAGFSAKDYLTSVKGYLRFIGDPARGPKYECEIWRASLRADGIETLIHYPVPIPRQPALQGQSPAVCPEADRVCATILSLPMYPGISEEDQRTVAGALRRLTA